MPKKHKIAEENILLLGQPKDGKAYTFEECLWYIDKTILLRKPRWLLNRISWIDYEDASQIIRSHIFIKWNKWDQSRPFANWCNSVVSHQTRNIIKKIYTDAIIPCHNCSANEGNNSCRIYGIQCATCPLYAKWLKSKSKKHAMQMADSYEEMQDTVKNSGVSHDHFKEYSPEKLHVLIKPLLTKFQAKVYDMMYVQNMDDIKVAESLGYKTSEKSRKIGYKSIQKLKKIFITKAKEVLVNNDL
jgi:hypothetical protein